MACFKPLRGRLSAAGIKFSKDDPGNIDVACGRCIGCRLDNSRQWAVRCCHEASLYDENSYLTLTYRDEDLPSDGSLRPEDFTLFMKRLRKAIYPRQVRYYMCGEYGDELSRPHYHALLFGYDFPDKRFHKRIKGNPSFVSERLSDLWGKGFCTIGAVTFESAAYVARYILKKQTGDKARAHYSHIDKGTGEIQKRVPEYTRMSLKPGIGAKWYEQFSGDVFPDDFVVLGGRKYKTPRYYDQLLGRDSPDKLAEVKEQRVSRMREKSISAPGEFSRERLETKEACTSRRVSHLTRAFETGEENWN